MGWLKLSLALDREAVPEAEAILAEFAPLAVTVTDAGDEPVLEPEPGAVPLWRACRLDGLFDLDVDLGALRSRLSARGMRADAVDFLDDADWRNRWRQYAVDFCFADRLWLVPRDVPAPGEPALHLDPGLAFGSGSHPTTRLCLHWLARADLAGKTLLDYGCGSGILALAALKLGAGDVLAVDHDPQALLATRENAAYNALAEAAAGMGRLEVGPPGAVGAGRFDVIVANILANPLIELAGVLADAMADGGVLIMSGLLAAQADEVMAAYPGLSFLPVAVEADDQGAEWARLEGWRTGG